MDEAKEFEARLKRLELVVFALAKGMHTQPSAGTLTDVIDGLKPEVLSYLQAGRMHQRHAKELVEKLFAPTDETRA